jgi:hypothetical protein
MTRRRLRKAAALHDQHAHAHVTPVRTPTVDDTDKGPGSRHTMSARPHAAGRFSHTRVKIQNDWLSVRSTGQPLALE